MDLMVKFFEGPLVVTRYWESKFLAHATAADLQKGFNEGTEGLPCNKMRQIGMDGPNVNLKMYKNLVLERRGSPDCPDLLDMGTCGLHTVHDAFKCGKKATDWKLDRTLKAFWKLFHDTPSQRADFMSLTECEEFPQKWCAVRWVDNARVIEKNLGLLPHVKTFISSLTSKTAPDTISFVKVKAACSDKLYEAKLKFFLSVANQLKPFLTHFQTDKPIMPFMAGELFNIIRGLAQRFLKRSVLEGAKSLTKLLTVDFIKLSFTPGCGYWIWC